VLYQKEGSEIVKKVGGVSVGYNAAWEGLRPYVTQLLNWHTPRYADFWLIYMQIVGYIKAHKIKGLLAPLYFNVLHFLVQCTDSLHVCVFSVQATPPMWR
jgi:hypothetical protein